MQLKNFTDFIVKCSLFEHKKHLLFRHLTVSKLMLYAKRTFNCSSNSDLIIRFLLLQVDIQLTLEWDSACWFRNETLSKRPILSAQGVVDFVTFKENCSPFLSMIYSVEFSLPILLVLLKIENFFNTFVLVFLVLEKMGQGGK